MDINDLRCFVHVYDNGNLTKAAKALFISQQALSKVISNLEKEIGAALFVRNSRGVTPTDLATGIITKAEGLVREFDAFSSDLLQRVEVERKTLKIGFSPGTFQVLCAPTLMEKIKKVMGFEVQLTGHSDVDCEEKLLNGMIDVAITVNPHNTKDFHFYSLFKDPLVVIMHKDHPLAKKKAVTLEDLKMESLILLDESFRLQKVLNHEFEKINLVPRIQSRFSHDLKITYDFVALKKGLFIFVSSLTDIQHNEKLCQVPLDAEVLWDVGLLMKNQGALLESQRKLLDIDFRKKNGVIDTV